MSATSPSGARRDRPLGIFYAGYTASMAADQIWLTTLGWSAAQLGDPLLTGLVLGAGTVPRAALMLVGGVLVDRVGIRVLALGTQIARVVGMAVAGLLAALFPDQWMPLLAVALVFGAISALNIPALASAPALLASPERLPRITAILQTGQRVATVVGAPVAGLLLASGGTVSAIVACAVLFAISLAAFYRTRLPEQQTSAEAAPPNLSGGIRYLRKDPVLRALLVCIAGLNIALMASLNVGLPLLVTERGWSASVFGLIEGCVGLGAVLGALAVIASRTPARPGRVALTLAAIQVPLLTCITYLDSPVAVALCAGGAGLALGPAAALFVGLVQARTQPSYIGRVVSVVNFISVGLTPIFYVVFSAITGITDLRSAFILAGAIQALAVAYGLMNTDLRSAGPSGTTDPNGKTGSA